MVPLVPACKDKALASSPSLVPWQSELVAMEIFVGLNEVKVHERWTPELASSGTAADATVDSNPLLGLDTSGASDGWRSPVDYSRYNDYITFKKVFLCYSVQLLCYRSSSAHFQIKMVNMCITLHLELFIFKDNENRYVILCR